MDKKSDVYLQIGPDGQKPIYATAGSAGCDLYLTVDIVLKPGQTTVLPVDFRIALEPGTEAQIRPRSGLSLKTTLRVPNSPGTIDSDYRDPVGVIVENTASHCSVIDDLMADPSLLDKLKSEYELTSFGDFWLRERQRESAIKNQYESTQNNVQTQENDQTQGNIRAQENAQTQGSVQEQENDQAQGSVQEQENDQAQVDQLAESATLPAALAVLPVYLDHEGNPYGTIYLKKGERIAQMVISRYQQANFIIHDDVTKLGHNRGGGFGSTGIGDLEK